MTCAPLRWITAVSLVLNLNFLSFLSVSAHQCSIQYYYKGCENDLSLNYPPLAEGPQDYDKDPSPYNDVICNCAYQTERTRYNYFAIKKERCGIIACYAIDIVLNDRNQLLQSECSQNCDQVGCVRLGTGDYAAIYQVIPSTITLPKTTTTTVRTEILRSTTRKPFVRPLPEHWHNRRVRNHALHDNTAVRRKKYTS